MSEIGNLRVTNHVILPAQLSGWMCCLHIDCLHYLAMHYMHGSMLVSFA